MWSLTELENKFFGFRLDGTVANAVDYLVKINSSTTNLTKAIYDSYNMFI